jgi:hypothetical protein
MLRRTLACFFLIMGMLVAASAQQDACKALEIPVGVVNLNGEEFRGLAPQDFMARLQKGPVSVKSLTYDDGPRRVLLVVDTSKKLSANQIKAETELVKTLIAAVRPEDSVGLITARGPGGTVKFGDPRANVLDAISGSGNTKGKDRGVLDAVLEGLEWFSPSRPGDAIVVIAHDLEGNHKANAKSVAKALTDHHVRLFGLAVGPIQTRNTTTSFYSTAASSQGLALATPATGDIIYNTGDEDFYPLTLNSGGLVGMVVDPDSKTYSDKMDDPRVQLRVKLWAQAIANAVDTFYRMVVEPPHAVHGEWWDLQLTEGIQKNSPKMFVLFPHSLGPC